MLYQTFTPALRLAPYVRFFWALEADVGPGEKFVHRSMADGSVEIVFHYRAAFNEIGPSESIEASPISSIQAQSTRFRRFVTSEGFGIFGAYLYPFAIPKLFGIAAHELTDISPDLYSVLGQDGKRLEEQICSAGGNVQRVAIMNCFLERRLDAMPRSLPPVHLAVRSVVSMKGSVSISKLAGEYGLSNRQFERRFKEFAGLSPKLYSRIIRFQAATEHKLRGTRDLTEIAYACGYYDQSHFINDFRQFSGYSPKQYFWNEAEGTQYMNS